MSFNGKATDLKARFLVLSVTQKNVYRQFYYFSMILIKINTPVGHTTVNSYSSRTLAMRILLGNIELRIVARWCSLISSSQEVSFLDLKGKDTLEDKTHFTTLTVSAALSL
jgi:hypothetical protein